MLDEVVTRSERFVAISFCPYGEIEDTLRLGRSAERHGGSNPSTGTIFKELGHETLGSERDNRERRF